MICTSCCYKRPLKMKAIMNKGTDVPSQKCEHLDVISELSQTCSISYELWPHVAGLNAENK